LGVGVHLVPDERREVDVSSRPPGAEGNANSLTDAGTLDSMLAYCYTCLIKMARGPTQLELQPRTWGGRRPGAGRKPTGRRVGAPHRARPPHVGRHPAHVTLRAQRLLPSLRHDRLFGALLRGLALGSRRGLRILEFSVQRDHLHLIVEADDSRAL